MQTPKEWPPVNPLLVQRLEAVFPDRVPGVTDAPKPDLDLPELYRRQGEQRVIRKLRSIAAEQSPADKVL